MWDQFILNPFTNVLLFIYNIIGHNFGVAIILFTILIRAVTWPLNAQQLKGAKELDCRVDIYALGATLYHAATGQTIHVADNEFSLLMKQASEPVKDPRELLPGLNGRFAELLVQMLELDSARRPATRARLSAIFSACAAVRRSATAARRARRPLTQSAVMRRSPLSITVPPV